MRRRRLRRCPCPGPRARPQLDTHMATKDLLTVSPCPVVQQSQYRLGFRWPKQMADEGDLDNRLHPDDERDSGNDLRADRGSRGHDGYESQIRS